MQTPFVDSFQHTAIQGEHHTMNTFIRPALLGLVVVLLSSCSYKVGFDASYLPPAVVAGKHAGKVLVLMSPQEQEWIYEGNPTSFTGGGTTLTAPLGNITKQVAIEVFSRHFDTVDTAEALPEDGQYIIVANPRIRHFEYAYNQLKNLGFAITPQIKVELDVTLFDNKNNKLMEKTYTSGLQAGESYMISISPEEKVNQALHKALFAQMTLAAQDALMVLSDDKP